MSENGVHNYAYVVKMESRGLESNTDSPTHVLLTLLALRFTSWPADKSVDFAVRRWTRETLRGRGREAGDWTQRLRLRDPEVETTTGWAQRQTRVTVTSNMASCHASLHPDNFPHQVSETITKRNPFRPGARRVVQSISTLEGCIYSVSFAPLALGCNDFHQDHQSFSNWAKGFIRKPWSFHGRWDFCQ